MTLTFLHLNWPDLPSPLSLFLSPSLYAPLPSPSLSPSFFSAKKANGRGLQIPRSQLPLLFLFSVHTGTILQLTKKIWDKQRRQALFSLLDCFQGVTKTGQLAKQGTSSNLARTLNYIYAIRWHVLLLNYHTVTAMTRQFILKLTQSKPSFHSQVSANVTLHHEMSRNVPDGHFHVFIFSQSQFYAIYNSQNHFQIRGLVAELHVFEYGDTTFGSFGKTCFTCWGLLC